MRLLLLLLAVQWPPPAASRATASDSATARVTLLTGLAAFDSINGDINSHMAAQRYLEQLLLWGLKEEGNGAALRFDRAAMRVYGTGSTIHTWRWLSLLLESGDTLAADRFTERMPPVTRDDVLSQSAQGFAYARPAIAARLEAKITKPFPRAEVMRHRALLTFRNDSAAGRALLAEAIALSRADSASMGTAWPWMVELLRRGGHVPVDEIVKAAMLAWGDLWNARIAVANALIENGLPHLTSSLVDSLAAGIERQEAARQPHSRIRLLQLRGTARDSAIATALQNSLDNAAILDSAVVQQRQFHGERGALYGSASPMNPDSLREVLSRPVSDATLAEFLEYLRSISLMHENTQYRPFAGDSMRGYAKIAVDMIGEMIRSRPMVIRDSLQVNRAAVTAYIDAAQGLQLARSIPTRRFRDRAVSEAVARLVRIDADAAEREAATLEDSTARARAYGALAQAAVAGGRLTAAASLAAKATGEQRVHALFDVAAAQSRSGLRDDARRTITSAFNDIDAEFRCDGCIVIPTPAPPLSRGTEPQLLSEVVFLTMQLGMLEHLLAWASMQQSTARRANAHLLVVEAMSRQLLRWTPPRPFHN